MDRLVNRMFLFVSVIILSSFILTGCTPKVNAREEAEKAVAIVIEYINKSDFDGLIAVFCEDVKENYELTSVGITTVMAIKPGTKDMIFAGEVNVITGSS